LGGRPAKITSRVPQNKFRRDAQKSGFYIV
jgi:hypothetical protein